MMLATSEHLTLSETTADIRLGMSTASFSQSQGESSVHSPVLPGLLLQSTPCTPKGCVTELSGLRTEHIQFSISDYFHLQNLKTNTTLLMPRIQTLVPSASLSVT